MVKKEKKDVIVSVRDFGIGISRSKQQKIFEKLYQVSDPMERTYPGLGLGLYISKEIVERHNGRIWVESEGKGKGATFLFTIPLADVE
jgi:signal transduction histidine kinase